MNFANIRIEEVSSDKIKNFIQEKRSEAPWLQGECDNVYTTVESAVLKDLDSMKELLDSDESLIANVFVNRCDSAYRYNFYVSSEDVQEISYEGEPYFEEVC